MPMVRIKSDYQRKIVPGVADIYELADFQNLNASACAFSFLNAPGICSVTVSF